ncbi:hypothetical protein GZ77_16475 [Endozoicomonas montiporae]|uniref:Transporter n=2 Tax=Endozoicomonas montiporae TaxID=1027273 RepID=A0A081N5Y5_9GAMM|nr:TolC family protein [Endozoicomonas montiporae]AMO57233.1 outer membrane efflux protein [Endozoicomonas montiporae CL-33]KEQ13858.1 hypothetical protein GZ77_16475 [Endozoicomonas montiporae]
MNNGFKITLLATSIFIAACSVQPVVISEQEHQARVAEDKSQLYTDQQPVGAELTLHQAIARAIRYNLDHRLKVMEQALASDMLDIARLDMLPKLTANAGYKGRNNDAGSSSRSLITGNESLEVSTSQERERLVGDLGLSWNVLDFGVSYYRAKEQADRLMIVEERRRKVIHNITQDVRSAYMRALAAQTVLGDIEPLMQRMDSALMASRKIENQGLKTPFESLLYQQRLLTSMRQLHEVRKDLVSARTELATLMSLPLSTDFKLVRPADPPLQMNIPADKLETLALLQRPELREEGYHDRISAMEIKRTMASLMPSLTLSTRYNYDSNEYNKNANWFDFSAMISGNLLDIVTLNDRLQVAKSQASVVDTRRLALNMAVLSQVHIALLDFSEASHAYQTDSALNDVEHRLLKYVKASASSQSGNELDVIEREINAVLAKLQQGESYAQLHSAYGRIFLSIGADPLPERITSHTIQGLADALASGESKWSHLDVEAEQQE